MRVSIVTLFPELFDSPLATSLLGKARAAGLVEVDFVNPRDFTTDRHRTVDDAPYGGGPGMVMKPDPLVAAIEHAAGAGQGTAPGFPRTLENQALGRPFEGGTPPGFLRTLENQALGRPVEGGAHRILLTPGGAPIDQARVRALAARPHLVLVCGRYEGIDERVSRVAIDEELSLGDFVLSGGEIAALALIDAVSRLVPGVLGDCASTVEESFSDGLTLEYPQYTRPPEFRGLAVPDVLIGGHHERVRTWRRREALRRTAARRPDLLRRRSLDAGDRAAAGDDPAILPAGRVTLVLAHHPVYDRTGAEVTSSVTNLDIHDIARSAATYGLAGTVAVSPVALQREKIAYIIETWLEEMAALARATPGHRGHALAAVEVRASIEDVVAELAARHGAAPLVVATSARVHEGPDMPATLGYEQLRRVLVEVAPARPIVLLLGTGHGLADRVITKADYMLAPVTGNPTFNHLSVRSAAAVILDRLFGTGA